MIYDLERLGAATGVAVRPEQPEAGAAQSTCLFCGTLHGLERALQHDEECGSCASPLFPAERHRFEFSGQRMLKRIPKRRVVEIRVTWPQEQPYVGEMRDLSLNGMSFVTAVALTLNQIVRIDSTEPRALGRIAHVEPDPADGPRSRTGIEFLTLRFWQVRGTFISAEV